MKIILEGVDGAGKSTLANKIKEDWFDNDVEIIKFSHGSPIALEDYEKALLTERKNIILDRFNLSEEVYSNVYKRVSKNSLYDHLMTFDLAHTIKSKYIILYSSDFEFLWERIHKRGDTEQVYENLRELNKYYKVMGLLLQTIYPDMIYLVDIAGVSDLYEYVKANVLREV